MHVRTHCIRAAARHTIPRERRSSHESGTVLSAHARARDRERATANRSHWRARARGHATALACAGARHQRPFHAHGQHHRAHVAVSYFSGRRSSRAEVVRVDGECGERTAYKP
eukprot:7383207-Prymnesium_polylepis.2